MLESFFKLKLNDFIEIMIVFSSSVCPKYDTWIVTVQYLGEQTS